MLALGIVLDQWAATAAAIARRLASGTSRADLNEYVHHTGSGVFACPPGLRPGQHWGHTLFT